VDFFAMALRLATHWVAFLQRLKNDSSGVDFLLVSLTQNNKFLVMLIFLL